MLKHILRISDFSVLEILEILKLSSQLKFTLKRTGKNKPIFHNQSLAMIFEKPSLRTRVSFEVGMTQLGGHAIYLNPTDLQMGKRESVVDISRTLSRYVDMIIARDFKHSLLDELAKHATVPVINALSDLEHPCQIMADLQTILECKKKLKGISLAFIGDGENNVTHSLAIAASLFGMDFRVASPHGYTMKRSIVQEAKRIARKTGAHIYETDDPRESVKNVDVVYTDTWVSMGEEKKKQVRLKKFTGFQVTKELMHLAKKDAVFMHDLPAHRGYEVATEVIDGQQSIIFDQAENRLHVQKAIMVFLIKDITKLA